MARVAIRKKDYSVITKRLIRILALGTSALFAYSAETPAQDRMRRNRVISIKPESSAIPEDHENHNNGDTTTIAHTVREPIAKLERKLWTAGAREEKLLERLAQRESKQTDKPQSNPKWQYGGFADLAYPLDFNHPANRLFRSRGTAFRT